MKSSLLATGLVGLAMVGLWFGGGGTQPLPAAHADDSPRVGEPLAHENLSVYFIHGTDAMPPGTKILSLPEALEHELAVVHETSNVNMLAVENKSEDCELFIQSGDIVKGGKQDRMAQTDMLLPPKSGVVPLPAHCVEQGRWTGRGNEDTRGFKSSTKCAVGNDMKIANFSGHQRAVWQSVEQQQTKTSNTLGVQVQAAASPTSFQLTLEAPAIQAKVAQYEAALKAAGEERDDIIGVVFAVNGNVTGAEVYGSNAIFRKAWPKLLNSAAVEAVAERTNKPLVAVPSAREVERFLARAAVPEPTAADLPLLTRSNTNVNGIQFGNITLAPDVLPEIERLEQIADGIQITFRERGNQIANPAANPRELEKVTLPNPAGAINLPPDPPVQQLASPITAVQDNVVIGGFAPLPPANPNGNRLNTNATVNPTSLMVESRDPTRQNAVIHRTYLKK
jgi:hypothetical protein